VLLRVTEEVLEAGVSVHLQEVVLEEEPTVRLQEVVVSVLLHAEVLVEGFHLQVEAAQAALAEAVDPEEVDFK
jgi:hypothetical protein